MSSNGPDERYPDDWQREEPETDVEKLPFGPHPRELRAELRMVHDRLEKRLEDIQRDRAIVVHADEQLRNDITLVKRLAGSMLEILDRHLGPVKPPKTKTLEEKWANDDRAPWLG